MTITVLLVSEISHWYSYSGLYSCRISDQFTEFCRAAVYVDHWPLWLGMFRLGLRNSAGNGLLESGDSPYPYSGLCFGLPR